SQVRSALTLGGSFRVKTVVFGYYTQEGGINLGKEDKRTIDFIKDIAEHPAGQGQS
ncbi:MAG: hypothetical protein IPN76_33810, partial [Saprospiraceae bacterium]|nr:hypothetical protein [Saprospiraceae bacterium]